MSEDTDILFEIKGRLAVITLNRAQALNALTLDMCRRFERQLAAWQTDPAVVAVLVKGTGERAYCAGGDVVAIYNSARGDRKLAAEFFRAEYCLNWRIFHFPKPYIALIDGITMGGGVGVSVHGSHRVATEHTLFAMPETGIGLFPDVGGSYFLPRLSGKLGLFLGLTGSRLKAADCLYTGIATQHCDSHRLDDLEEALAGSDLSASPDEIVGGILQHCHQDPGAAPLAEHRQTIDRCFAEATVDAILEALASQGDVWADKIAEGLRRCSPTSLKITMKQLRDGADLDFDAAMVIEYRLSQACVAGHDMVEGVRAAVIDKDRSPQWDPAALDAVSKDLVEAHFAPRPGDELSFPTD